MRVFVITYIGNYGEYVEVITAKNEESLEKFISDDAKGWNDYIVDELDLSKEGNIILGGGDL